MIPASAAVRERARIIGNTIDHIASNENNRNIRVLSIACGHLREASLSKAIRDGKVSEYVAFDQDVDSLKIVTQNYSTFGVAPIEGSVRSLLERKNLSSLGQFDYVYSTGLFDYLPDPVAFALTTVMFELTKPGGKLHIANMLPTTIEQGYIEAFTAWKLIYRDMLDIEKLAHEIPSIQIENMLYFTDIYQRVGYLEINKRHLNQWPTSSLCML